MIMYIEAQSKWFIDIRVDFVLCLHVLYIIYVFALKPVTSCSKAELIFVCTLHYKIVTNAHSFQLWLRIIELK